MLPFELSFDYVMDMLAEPPFSYIMHVVYGAYVVDILIGFNTSVINPFTGDEYFSWRQIIPHYLGGAFLVDLLSTVYFNEIRLYLGNTNLSLKLLCDLLRLLKVLRLGGIEKMIRDSQISVESKGALQVVYVTLVLVIYTHVVACIMWHMLKTKRLWVPAVDFGGVYSAVFTGLEREDRDDVDFFWYQYSSAWYNSLLAFMLVEVNPRSITQIGVMCVIYILNAIVNAVLFGIFFDQFEVIRRKEKAAQAEIDEANAVMTNLGMTSALKGEI